MQTQEKERLLRWLVGLILGPAKFPLSQFGAEKAVIALAAYLKAETLGITSRCYRVSWKRLEWHVHEKLCDMQSIHIIQAWAGLRRDRRSGLDEQSDLIQEVAKQFQQHLENAYVAQASGLHLSLQLLMEINYVDIGILPKLSDLQRELSKFNRACICARRRVPKIRALLKDAQGKKNEAQIRRVKEINRRWVTPYTEQLIGGWAAVLRRYAESFGMSSEVLRDAMVGVVTSTLTLEGRETETFVRAHDVLDEVFHVSAPQALTLHLELEDPAEVAVGRRILQDAVAAADNIESYRLQMIVT